MISTQMLTGGWVGGYLPLPYGLVGRGKATGCAGAMAAAALVAGFPVVPGTPPDVGVLNSCNASIGGV